MSLMSPRKTARAQASSRQMGRMLRRRAVLLWLLFAVAAALLAAGNVVADLALIHASP